MFACTGSANRTRELHVVVGGLNASCHSIVWLDIQVWYSMYIQYVYTVIVWWDIQVWYSMYIQYTVCIYIQYVYIYSMYIYIMYSGSGSKQSALWCLQPSASLRFGSSSALWFPPFCCEKSYMLIPQVAPAHLTRPGSY